MSFRIGQTSDAYFAFGLIYDPHSLNRLIGELIVVFLIQPSILLQSVTTKKRKQ